jgi:hypothetical protein
MKRILAATALALAVTISAGGCSSTQKPDPGDAIVGEGTVYRGVGPECPEVWHVATTQGAMLWPVDDTAFQVEGLPVRFRARERSGTASICMAGKNVEFTLLEKL